MKNYILALVSFCGFQIMLLEMCGFRVLATHFGSSIFATGTFLALILAFLSSGYFYGGRLSKSSRSIGTFLFFLFAAVICVVASNTLFSEAILNYFFQMRVRMAPFPMLREIVPPLLVTVILYGAPMFVLSQATPYLIRFLLKEREAGGIQPSAYDLATALPGLSEKAKHDLKQLEAEPDLRFLEKALSTQSLTLDQVLQVSSLQNGNGKNDSRIGTTTGMLLGLSTLGSLLGTFLTSYLFIPYWGVQNTLLIFYVSTLLMGTLGLIISKNSPVMSLLPGVCCLLLLYSFLRGPSLRDPNLVHEEETLYGNVKLIERELEPGNKVLFYHPSRLYVHSALNLEKPLSFHFSLQYITTAAATEAKKILILGAGAGANIRMLLAHNPDLNIDAVEIDPAVLRLSQEYYSVKPTQKVKLVAQDARTFLKESEKTYDHIIVDLFLGESLPVHCMTEEFFSLVFDHLAPEGSIFMNSNMRDFHFPVGKRNPPFRPLRHLQSTLFHSGFESQFENSVFPGLIAFKSRLSRTDLMTIFAKALEEENLDMNLRAAIAQTAVGSIEVPHSREETRPFTDEWAPDHLIQLKSNSKELWKSFLANFKVPMIREAHSNSGLQSITIGNVLSNGVAPENWTPAQFESYLQEISDWLSAGNKIPVRDLPKYLILPPMIEHSFLRDHSFRNIPEIAGYIHGVRSQSPSKVLSSLRPLVYR